MKTLIFPVLLLITVLGIGCAAFEQTPHDVENKLRNPGGGRLYEPDPTSAP